MQDWRFILSSGVSTLVLALVGYGLHRRHERRVHIPIMLTCFALDVANVLFIEVGRGAVAKALDTATRGGEWLLKVHIAFSVMSLLGYIVAAITGMKLRKGIDVRKIHRWNGAIFLLNRVSNYVTSFMV